jgi:hypothetical protein
MTEIERDIEKQQQKKRGEEAFRRKQVCPESFALNGAHRIMEIGSG